MFQKTDLSIIIDRFNIAYIAIEALGSALLSLRGKKITSRESHFGQLKTPVDKAAEAWICTYIQSLYPQDRFLAEESFEEKNITWDKPANYWTIDAVDGTRSFIEGYDGFCIQVAYIMNKVPVLGIIHEPVRHITYWGIKGSGAYKQVQERKAKKLVLTTYSEWPKRPIFIDSTYPRGNIGLLMKKHIGNFLECGSIGLKICRVAEGKAHVFVKALKFKLWDVAPGQIILNEAGGRLSLWDGSKIFYGGEQVYYDNLIAAPKGLSQYIVQEL